MTRATLHPRMNRRLALFLAWLFLFNTLFPTGFAAAQILLTAKPGLGVSRVPLSAMAFDAPGFGDLAEAINLANGNVYVAVDALSNNTQQKDTSDTIGKSGWNFTPRLELEEFRENTPSNLNRLTLTSGDGSISSFERVLPSACSGSYPKFNFNDAPSWIKRYDSSALRCSRKFYRLETKPGLSFAASYIVLKPGTDSIAHFYAADGSRTTFHKDGRFADYTQTPHQQYEGATQNDPEGTSAASPKTEFKYRTCISCNDAYYGRIASVTDAHGRVTKYEWGVRHRAHVLTDVHYLLSDGTSTSSAARSISLEYTGEVPGQVLVSSVTYTTYDGQDGDNEVSRTIRFTYHPDGFLKTTVRPTAGGDLTTEYGYDAYYRVRWVEQTGQPRQEYDYSGTSEDYGGTLVKVTQGEGEGAKYSEYHFDEANKLRKKFVKDSTSNEGVEKGVSQDGTIQGLAWRYAYYDSGNVGLIEEPSGKVTHLIYDERGNLTHEAVYSDRNYFDQVYRKPAALTIERTGNTYGTRDEFSLTVKVERDELEKGITWYLVMDKNGGEKEYLLDRTRSIWSGNEWSGGLIPVDSEVTERGDDYYKVQATFKMTKYGSSFYRVPRPVKLRARSNLDPSEAATVTLTYSPRIREIDLTPKTNFLIVAPDCVRPRSDVYSNPEYQTWRNGRKTTVSTCSSSYSIVKSVDVDVESWVSNPSAYKDVTYSITKYSYKGVSGVSAPTIDAKTGKLSIPWHQKLSDRASGNTPDSITIVAKSKTETWKKSQEVTINLGFFGIRQATQGRGQWDVPNPNDLNYKRQYQFAVELYNSPYKYLRVDWYSPVTSEYAVRGFDHYGEKLPAGCFAMKNAGFLWEAKTVQLKAWVDHPKFEDVSVSGNIRTMARFWGIGGAGSETCGGYKTGNGIANNSSLSPQSYVKPIAPETYDTIEFNADISPDYFRSEELRLSPEPRPNEEYRTSYRYDGDNRLEEATTHAPVGLNDGYLSHTYEDVTEGVSYTDYSVTIAGQTFKAIQKAEHSTTVGSTQKRTREDVYATNGLLQSSTLKWDGEWRKTAYTYYASGALAQLVRPSSDGTATLSVTQYSDQVKKVVTTSSVKPLHSESADEIEQTFVYDRLGHIAAETLSGVVSEVDPLTFAEHATERAFNGFGQPVWERVRLGDAVASERGFAYHASGELQSEWAGTKQNLSLYEYHADQSSVGLLKAIKRGVASVNGALTTIRQEVAYGYDGFHRLASETSKVGDETHTTSFAYDTLDRVTQTTLPDGAVVKTSYDVHGEVATLDEPYVLRSFERNVMGYLEKESVDAKDGERNDYIVEYGHDALGRVIHMLPSITDINPSASDRATLFRYDSEGNLRCEIGPALRTASHKHALTDDRRTGVTYTYDDLGRKVEQRQMLYGGAAKDGGCNLAAGNQAGSNLERDTAKTTYRYDGLGNVELIVDAEGYRTESAYDAAGQVFLSRRQVEKNNDQYAEVWTAFDGAGRPIKVKDPLGYTRESHYDSLGNVLEEVNEAGHLVKRYTYTADGLLETIEEPQMTDGTRDDTLSMVATQVNVYGQQHMHPTAVYRASMDKTPSKGASGASGGVRTSYVYDWAGRVTETTLPDGATITQNYDLLGNVTELTSADGFTTNYTYDYAGRLLSETKHAREGNATDEAAGLGGGLTSTYTYDTFGNLVEEEVRGLTTTYVYNSLGEVIAESRPMHGGESDLYKRYAYRLDGAKTAATSYTYADDGSLKAAQRFALDNGVGGLTAGSIETYGLDKLGRVVSERTEGVRSETADEDENAPDFSLTGSVLEKLVTYERNGLGLATARTLSNQSAADVYAGLRDPETGRFLTMSGGRPIVGYTTRYDYSLRGELLERVDEIANVDAVGNPSGGVEQANRFTYTYTLTGKQKTAYRDLSVRVLRLQGEDQNFAPESVLLAATQGTITSSYNERDLLRHTVVEDRAIDGKDTLETTPLKQSTTYSYYKDGSKREVKVGEDTVTYQYDTRNRVVLVKDSNGTTAPSRAGHDDASSQRVFKGSGAAEIATEYNGDVVTETVTWDSCTYTETTTYALETFKHIEETVNTCNPDKPETSEAATSSSTTVYTPAGLVDKVYGEDKYYIKLPSSATTDYLLVTNDYQNPPEKNHMSLSYNTFGDVVEQEQASTFSHPPYAIEYEVDIPYYDADCDEEEEKKEEPDYSKCWKEQSETRTQTISNSGEDNVRTETFAYTENGFLLSEVVANSNGGKSYTEGEKEVHYRLDAVGNRIGVRGGPYDGYIKRYNADGQVAMFYLYQDGKDVPYSKRGQGAYSDFIYDPAGELVLSASSTIHQQAQTLYNDRLRRDYSSTYTSEGDVQLLRKRWGSQKISNLNDEGWADEREVRWDHTFSLADGMYSQTRWNAAELFEVTAPSTPLAAPTSSISDRLGVAPAEVAAPSTELPDLDTGDVLAPVEEDVPTDDGTVVNTQASSWTSDSLPALAPLERSSQPAQPQQWSDAALPEGEVSAVAEPDAATSTPAAQSEPQAPSSALPEVLNTTDALDIVAPSSLIAPLPPVGDATEVLPPGSAAPPSVGAGPSDGPLDIVPPAEIQPPTVPIIGTTPDAITAVAPPPDWREDTPFVEAFGSGSSGSRICKTVRGVRVCGSVKNVNRVAARIKASANASTGGRQVELEVSVEALESALNYTADLTEQKLGKTAADQLREMFGELSKGVREGSFGEINYADLYNLSVNIATGIDVGNILAGDISDAYEFYITRVPTSGETFEPINFGFLRDRMADGMYVNDSRAIIGSMEMLDARAQGYANSIEMWSDEVSGDRHLFSNLALIAPFILDLLPTRWLKGSRAGRGGRALSATRAGKLSGLDAQTLNARFNRGRPSIRSRIAYGCPNSFSADTPVATPYGLIAIATLVKEKIQEIFGYNEETGEVDVFTVTHYHVHDDPVTYDIVVDDDVTDNIPGELVETTPEHPFYVLGQWIDAEDLEVGMPLSTYEGTDLVHSGTVTSIERIEQTQTMYNLTVDTAHTFFVGEGQWLVHNCGDLISPQRQNHILNGDSTGGGHLWPGQPGHTPFPQSWSGDDILDNLADIATDPNTQWYRQVGVDPIWTNKGDPRRWTAWETRNGVRVKIVYEPGTGEIITGFPDSRPIPNGLIQVP